MKIGIASDHAAFEYKTLIKKYVEDKYGYEVVDYGTYSQESTSYAIYGEKLANGVANKEVEKGIAICGSGIGISIACNKVKGIRCAACSEEYSAKMSRLHNDANIIAFGARVVGIDVAKNIVDAFLENEFEGGRHINRVSYFTEIENKQK